MSKISEKKALEAYPQKYDNSLDTNVHRRIGYQQGYEQAIQDFLEKAKKWIEYEWSNLLVANLMFNSFKNYMQNESEN